MPTSTVPDAIPAPVTTDQVSPLATWFTGIASAIQTALNKRQKYTYRWPTATERGAQAGGRVGDTGYQIDTNTEYRHDGTVWRVWSMAWRGYTPTLSTMSIGNGTINASYCVSEGMVHTAVLIGFGSSTSIGTGLPSVSLPLTAGIVSSGGAAVGGLSVNYLDSGNSYYNAFGVITANTVILGITLPSGAIGALNPTSPMTWSTGDSIQLSVSYRPVA